MVSGSEPERAMIRRTYIPERTPPGDDETYHQFLPVIPSGRALAPWNLCIKVLPGMASPGGIRTSVGHRATERAAVERAGRRARGSCAPISERTAPGDAKASKQWSALDPGGSRVSGPEFCLSRSAWHEHSRRRSRVHGHKH